MRRRHDMGIDIRRREPRLKEECDGLFFRQI
jgi:hypothetical protein